jgi:hypothetical protein
MLRFAIPSNAVAAACPNCGRVHRNLNMHAMNRGIGCLCGAILEIERDDLQCQWEVDRGPGAKKANQSG